MTQDQFEYLVLDTVYYITIMLVLSINMFAVGLLTACIV
jgi:hypothetical protein